MSRLYLVGKFFPEVKIRVLKKGIEGKAPIYHPGKRAYLEAMIRPARYDDIKRIEVLQESYFAEPPRTNWDDRAKNLNNKPWAHFFGMFDPIMRMFRGHKIIPFHSEIIGLLEVDLEEKSLIITRFENFNRFSVYPRSRYRGIGTGLLKFAVELGSARRLQRVEVRGWGIPEDVSRLFLPLGFKICGTNFVFDLTKKPAV